MPDLIRITGTAIRPGEDRQIYLRISRLPTRTASDVPVFVFRAKLDGPVLLVMAGMHGDEINGVEMIRQMLTRKMLRPMRGSVIAIPLINIYGFLNGTRELPDGRDLNRSFPGSSTGSLAAQTAHALQSEILSQIDYGLDFHTGGGGRTNIHQIRCDFNFESNLPLAKTFAAPFAVHAKPRDHTFRQEAQKAGKPILVFEGGECNRFDENYVELGMRGVLRVMRHLKMIARCPSAKPTQLLNRSSWLRAPEAGLFRSFIPLGKHVFKKQSLASVSDPFGEMESGIFSEHKGYVIGLNTQPMVYKGDALVHVGYNSRKKPGETNHEKGIDAPEV